MLRNDSIISTLDLTWKPNTMPTSFTSTTTVRDTYLCLYWSPRERNYTSYQANDVRRVSASNARHAVVVAGFSMIVKDAKVLVINLTTMKATEFLQTETRKPVTTFETVRKLEELKPY